MIALLVAFASPMFADVELFATTPAPDLTNVRCPNSALNTDSEGYVSHDSFQLAGASTITEVTWDGEYRVWEADPPQPAIPVGSAWRLSFYADNGGIPGTALTSVEIPGGSVTRTLLFNTDIEGVSFPIYRFSAQLPAPLSLAAGTTYWFSAVSRQPIGVGLSMFCWWPATEPGSYHQINYWDAAPLIPNTNNLSFSLIGIGPPELSLVSGISVLPSGSSLSLGTSGINFQTSTSFTITNNGTGPLTGIAVAISPPGNPDFQVDSPPALMTLEIGESTTFSVEFSPEVIGNHVATLNITSNADPSPHVVQLSGTGVDGFPPLISPPAGPLSLAGGDPGNTAAIAAWLANNGGAIAMDNSGTAVTWTNNYTTPPLITESVSVTFTATDASGNSSNTSALLSILDQTPPQITNPAMPLTVLCDDPNQTDLINAWLGAYGGATATDNDGPLTWSDNFTTLVGVCGMQTVIFTVTDPSGNSSTSEALLTVQDSTAPVITTPASSTTVESDGNGNAFSLNTWLNSLGGATATDNCGAVTWTHDFTGLANNLPQTVSVIFSANDACGNSTSTTASFTIEDTTPPLLTVPASDFYGDCNNIATSLASYLASNGGATIVDAAGPVTWTNDYVGPPPVCEESILVTFTATDAEGLSTSTSSRFILAPPGSIWVGPPTGTWATASAWYTLIPGVTLDAYIDLFDFQDTSVTVPSGIARIKNLFIGQGDMLTVTNASLYSHGELIRNSGTIEIQTPTAGGSSNFYIVGPTSLEGSGDIILSGSGSNQLTFGASSINDVLTVGSNHTVTATADTIGNNVKTSIQVRLDNDGLVTADGGGLSLFLTPKVNNGIFRAINGGTLRMQAAIDSTNGTLSADAGSTLWLQTTLTGGSVTGDGQLLMNSISGLTGPLTLDAGLTTEVDAGGSTTLSGAITNNGLFTFGKADGTGTSFIFLNGPATLTGSGTLRFQGAGRRIISGAGSVLTLGANQEITTDANTIATNIESSIQAGLENYGTVTADTGGLQLYTQPKTNHATFRAINGGRLEILGSALTNYDAVTDTLTGGNWEVVTNGPPTEMEILSSPIVTIAGGTTVRLSGGAATLPQLSGLEFMNGTLSLENGQTLATTGNMAIPGLLQFGLPDGATSGYSSTQLAIAGDVDFSGTTVNILDQGLSSGSYILATWSGTLSGIPTLGSIPAGSQQTLVIDQAAKNLRFEFVAYPQTENLTFSVTPGTGPEAGMLNINFSATGEPNVDYVVVASTDLIVWTPVSPIINSPTGALVWSSLQPGTTFPRFFRFRVP